MTKPETPTYHKRSRAWSYPCCPLCKSLSFTFPGCRRRSSRAWETG